MAFSFEFSQYNGIIYTCEVTMIYEASLNAPIPDAFKIPAWRLSKCSSPARFYLMGIPPLGVDLPMPCQHCGGGLSLLGTFPWDDCKGLRVWQCLDCLHTSFGNHHIEWLSHEVLQQQPPVEVQCFLQEEQIWSTPGHQHCHQNPWLREWYQDGGQLPEKQPEPNQIQVQGWSSSYFAAIDLRAKVFQRSSTLLLQLDGSNIDKQFSGMLKYYHCPLSQKTLLDHEPKP
jgi:hypothetical protein